MLFCPPKYVFWNGYTTPIICAKVFRQAAVWVPKCRQALVHCITAQSITTPLDMKNENWTCVKADHDDSAEDELLGSIKRCCVRKSSVEVANNSDSNRLVVVPCRMCTFRIPSTTFVHSAIFPNQEVVPDITPFWKSHSIICAWVYSEQFTDKVNNISLLHVKTPLYFRNICDYIWITRRDCWSFNNFTAVY